MASNDLPTEIARGFLQSLQRFDLAALLEPCSIAVRDERNGQFIDDEWYPNITETVAIAIAPSPVDNALSVLPDHDRKRIAEAIGNGFKRTDTFDDFRVERCPDNATGAAVLLAEVIIHREMMISVSTGQQRIQDVNDYYIAREVRIRKQLPADIGYENPHADLWAWFHYWKEQYGSYAGRRKYVRDLFKPVIDALSNRSLAPMDRRQPSGWERVDRALGKARSQFELASAEEDYQAVGLFCREVIISLAQAVFDPAIHQTVDGVAASKTDANRMLESYVADIFSGESYKEVRAHHRAALALALNLQHRRTATRTLAALCVEATASTVSVVSIIARGTSKFQI